MRRTWSRLIVSIVAAMIAAAGGAGLALAAPSGTHSPAPRHSAVHASAKPNQAKPKPKPKPKVVPPSITKVSTAVKGIVTITGKGFTRVTAVTFGGKKAKYKVVSATKITATPPSGNTGTVKVRVVTKHGTSVLSAKTVYAYPKPVTTTPTKTVVQTTTVTQTTTVAQTTTVSTPPSNGTLAIVAGRNRAVVPGPATSTPIQDNSVAVDSSGNEYIADPANRVVEKVTPSGTLSIFAGQIGQEGDSVPGPATSTRLNEPVSVAVDSAGNVYVADEYDETIDKITPGGTLSIVAGNGDYGPATPGGLATSSELEYPGAVAIDSSGDIYFADEEDYRVYEVTKATGDLSVVAGTGTEGAPTAGTATSSDLGYIEGLAIASTGVVYMADPNYDVVEKVSGGMLSIEAGKVNMAGSPTAGTPTNSKLDEPEGVALDSSGNLYISDTYNEDIEEVAAGSLSVFAGTGDFGPAKPGPATGTSFDEPSDVAVGPGNALYVADLDNGSVEKIASGTVSIVAGFGSLDGPPTAGPGAASTLDYPSGVALDSGGNLYIADSSNDDIEKVTPGGALSILATGHFSDPEGIAVDSGGNIYVSDTDHCEIDKLSADGTSLSIIAGTGTCGPAANGAALNSKLDYPQGIAVDSAGAVYVADRDNCTVDKISAGALTIIAGTPGTCGPVVPGTATSSPLDDPDGVAVDASGNVYIADTDNYEIDKVTPGGTLSVAVGDGEDGEPLAKPAADIGLNQPEGVAVDASGNLYVADTDNDLIDRVSPAGIVSVLAGSGDGGLPTPGPAQLSGLDDPEAVAVNSAGTLLYFTDTDNSDVDGLSGF